MKYRVLVKRVKADGWYEARARGSHLVFLHPSKPGHVTIPAGGNLNEEVKPGTLRSILKQAGLKP